MSLEEFNRRKAAKEAKEADSKRNTLHMQRIARKRLAKQFKEESDNLDLGWGTPSNNRMIRDNPDIKRFHPDYGGVPGKGVPKQQWYGTGNHPLNR